MSLSPIFTFAPIPLTSELSPLAHAAALARRRQAENQTYGHAAPRHRIRPAMDKKLIESVSALS